MAKRVIRRYPIPKPTQSAKLPGSPMPLVAPPATNVQQPATTHRIVTLDEHTLRSLARNPKVTQVFSFFLAGKSDGCGSCGSRKSKVDYHAIKQQVVALSQEDKAKLKELLRATTVQLHVLQAGRSTKLVF